MGHTVWRKGSKDRKVRSEQNVELIHILNVPTKVHILVKNSDLI